MKPCIVSPEMGPDNEISSETVYISNHGWHTGFIIPAGVINYELPELAIRFGNVPYYEFGWGDAEYYQAKKITSGLTVKAILWPTYTVIKVVAVTDEPEKYFPHSEVVRIPVTENELRSLKKFIMLSFARDFDGNILALNKGIYGNRQFYQAEGKYFFANTCNKWTAKGLKSSGKDICVVFKLTAGSIMNYLTEAGFSKSLPTQ
jgi:uncharacterized protein (TIGR02117 family)